MLVISHTLKGHCSLPVKYTQEEKETCHAKQLQALGTEEKMLLTMSFSCVIYRSVILPVKGTLVTLSISHPLSIIFSLNIFILVIPVHSQLFYNSALPSVL